MAKQALYRKYRPQTFEEVVGQEHITRTLANQVKSGEISHAYLFTGSRGTGKTSTARIFAKAINCENNVNGSPCLKCANCQNLAQQSNVDIIEIDAASNNRVDEIRQLRENVKFAPATSKYKVYIIDEVHMLTDSAFNALLKTLEEPPSHIVFILGTTEVQKLPATIISRCLEFDFRLVPLDTLQNLLKQIFQKENIVCTDEALRILAASGEGSVRDMLSIADCCCAYSKNLDAQTVLKVLGKNNIDILVDFINCVSNKQVGKCLEKINEIYNSGKNLVVFARELAETYRQLLICKTCNKPQDILPLTSEDVEKLTNISEQMLEEDLIRNLGLFSEVELQLKFAISPRVLLENAILDSISGDVIKKNE